MKAHSCGLIRLNAEQMRNQFEKKVGLPVIGMLINQLRLDTVRFNRMRYENQLFCRKNVGENRRAALLVPPSLNSLIIPRRQSIAAISHENAPRFLRPLLPPPPPPPTKLEVGLKMGNISEATNEVHTECSVPPLERETVPFRMFKNDDD